MSARVPVRHRGFRPRVAPDARPRARSEQAPGRDGFIAFVSRLHAAFPDLQIDIEDEVAAGDKVLVRYQVTGTHQGDFMGLAGTGRQLTWPAMMLANVKNGQVAEIWLQWDRLAVMQQLGVIPRSG